MKIKSSVLAVSTCLLLNTVTFNAMADINLNGFASIVAGSTTASNEQFLGYEDSVDFKQGSLFALQASSDLADGLSVTAQVLARGEDDWATKFEWAYISYEVNDDFRILAGRQRAPFYMYSDFLDVSYAYAWIKPPGGVYDLVFDTFDGLGAIYTTNFGEFDTTFHMIYGMNTDELDAFGVKTTPKFKNLVGGSLTINRDWLTLRAAYFRTDTDLPADALQPLIGGWQQAGFADVANNVEVAGDTATFAEFGMQINYNSFVMAAEYTQLTVDNTSLADEKSYYVMAGKQFDSVLIHLTYGVDKDTKDSLTAGVPVGVDPGLDFLIASTNGVVNSQLNDESYVTLGLRWDFHDSAAFKLEYTDFQDDFNLSGDAALLRAAIVTVF
jgi:hypothetical protein